MTDLQKDQAVAQIVASLTQRARERWGSDRALALEEFIEQAAQAIRQIERDPPPGDVEPGFHM